jgi:dTDP-4-amino-4,6-dideoxygalactose transaminase
MQFIDLEAQQKRIRRQLEERIRSVLDHGRYILGPEVDELETALADFTGTQHAISCASGTDALLMALMAYGVGPGDGVLTTPFTFIATAEVIRLLGAVPVFVDIDPDTFNLNPAHLNPAVAAVRNRDSSRYPIPAIDVEPKGIIAVDLFGLPADYDAIHAVAQKQGLFVIEDAAQSLGAESGGKPAGSLAQIGCTSFFPAKPLGCYGDGGMCFTNDTALAEALTSIRVHGKGTHKYDNIRTGINGRLDTLQAAILLAKLDIFSEEVLLRQQAAERYTALLASRQTVRAPVVSAGFKSVWAQYSLLAKDEHHRSEIQGALKEAGIPSAVYYPKPLHLQSAYADLGYARGSFPISEDYSFRVFSIPMHPYLKEEDQQKIVETL